MNESLKLHFYLLSYMFKYVYIDSRMEQHTVFDVFLCLLINVYMWIKA